MATDVDKHYAIQSYHSVVTETRQLNDKRLDQPLVKAAVGAVITDPFAGQGFQEDLSSLTEHSAALGLELGRRAVALLGGLAVEGYGKGGIAGADSAQE
ncbi:MAG: amino acid synthesis family protein, partial [Microbacteriaceae bacterium]